MGSRAQLAATVRDLLTQLERHLAAEERLLAAASRPAPAPGITAATGRRHEWYPLTEGPVIDLDLLPSGQVADAAVDRLLRLRPGEQVLRCGRPRRLMSVGHADLPPAASAGAGLGGQGGAPVYPYHHLTPGGRAGPAALTRTVLSVLARPCRMPLAESQQLPAGTNPHNAP